MAFRSQWRFAAKFCAPGKGREKVDVEGGYFWRNHPAPASRVDDRDAPNPLLLRRSAADMPIAVTGWRPDVRFTKGAKDLAGRVVKDLHGQSARLVNHAKRSRAGSRVHRLWVGHCSERNSIGGG
jgi:hypothetical protein